MHRSRIVQGKGQTRPPARAVRPRPLGFLDAVDGGDVRMVETGENLGFSLEPRQPVRISGKRLGQDLQRDITVELRIRGTPHFPHPAFAEFGGDFVMPEPCADAKQH